MPWYKAGTVALTAGSATVTGTGTAFSANARVGDAFIVPGVQIYEVTNIASATVLTISPAFGGTTAASSAYALAPMQGYVKASADALNSLVQQFGVTLATLGTAAFATITTSATDSTAGRLLKVGDFGLSGTAIAVATGVDLNTIKTNGFYSLEAGTWANTPIAGNFYLIVSSSASSVKQIIFYRGSANTASRYYDISAGTWGPWDYSYTRGNVVGTVSQASGLVTGAIIETGTNANGTYTKYADGSMTCTRRVSVSVALANAVGNGGYYGAVAAQGIASTFISTPTVSFSNEDTAGLSWAGSAFAGPGVSAWASFPIVAASGPIPARTYIVNFVATGRWF